MKKAETMATRRGTSGSAAFKSHPLIETAEGVCSGLKAIGGVALTTMRYDGTEIGLTAWKDTHFFAPVLYIVERGHCGKPSVVSVKDGFASWHFCEIHFTKRLITKFHVFRQNFYCQDLWNRCWDSAEHQEGVCVACNKEFNRSAEWVEK